jgi:type IV pilus assembly protein PilC
MVRSGETTGKLDEVLEYLATQKEQDYDLLSKVRGAMTYPIVLLGGVLVVGIGLSLFVLPSLLDVFAQGGATLPLPTRILMGFVHIMQSYWYLMFLALIGLVAAFIGFKRTKKGKHAIDFAKIKFPILGRIFVMLYLTRMSRSISTLLSAGVPISQSLEITADVVDNEIYRAILRKTIKEVEDGNSITTVFAKSKEVPLMVSQMMAIGEQSGRMDQILQKVAEFFDRDLQNMVSNLVTLIEPIVLMIMGGAVGFLVAAILLPIYNLSSAI